jgi:hypothetical protein
MMMVGNWLFLIICFNCCQFSYFPGSLEKLRENYDASVGKTSPELCMGRPWGPIEKSKSHGAPLGKLEIGNWGNWKYLFSNQILSDKMHIV